MHLAEPTSYARLLDGLPQCVAATFRLTLDEVEAAPLRAGER